MLRVRAGTFVGLALPLQMSASGCFFWTDFLWLRGLRLGSLAGVADIGLAGTGAGEARAQSCNAGAADAILGFLDVGEVVCFSGWAHCS